MSSEHKAMNLLLMITAFIAGFVTMVLEIVGFRIFAPYFGYSIFVSGTLISIVMVALTLGAYVGGYLADKKGDYNTIFFWIFLSMVYVFAALVTYKPILAFFADMFLTGVVLASVILFAFPMVVLSMVSPYLIKLIAEKEEVGKAAGNISAIGTVGAIIGTVSATFLFIPAIGSFATFFICGLSLMMIVTVYFAAKNKFVFLNLLFILTIFFNTGSTEANVILETESVYNLIKVVQVEESKHWLQLNDNQNVQSIYDPNNLHDERYYFYYVNTAPLMNNASSLLVLGMGAGTCALEMIDFYGLEVDAVEIDPKVAEVAEDYFGLDTVKDKITIHVDDARPFLRRIDKKYDLVQVDMFQGGFYAPFYVLTQEFFEETKAVLNPDGIVVVNVLYPIQHKEGSLLFHSIGNTMTKVFKNVYFLNLNYFNVIMFATDEDVTLEQIKERVRTGAPPEFERSEEIANSLQQYNYNPGSIILTDDKAPIDYLTFRVLAE
ncbi:fused MFS/spermidine synthase [Candidatus Woesearchaeota archaeon]|nr:fused MFS/spermidine synthase [Candidatus Woesearchaeota archaeon]